MRIWMTVVLVCVGCGGAISGDLSAVPVDVTSPIQAGAQRVVTEAEANAMSGLDCSVTPCPADLNLQCVSLAGKRECFYVLRPTDGCLGVKVDRTSTGETTPVICAAQCQSSDLPGAPTCPHGLTCSNDAARICFH